MGLASRKRHQEMLAARRVKKAGGSADAASDSASSVGMSTTAAAHDSTVASMPALPSARTPALPPTRTPAPPFAAPIITESHLLAFQLSHFGDNTKPDNWFVDAETALTVHLAQDEHDDGLGYYDDGAKRTLTDAQIAIFRHSEIEELLREERLQRDEDDYQNRDPNEEGAHSPMSDASSIEGDLLGLARPPPKKRAPPPPKELSLPPPPPSRRPSQSSRSESSRSTARSRGASRKRKQEVPYDQRHKRKWETFVQEQHPEEGSLTHRRIVRELDDLTAESVEMDY
ncbi:hypothetical protein LTR08_005313 [Meristemomyces frigidus]|nr:hypothetical protein LTR08_005313 [Meristemomyces frigidus]